MPSTLPLADTRDMIGLHQVFRDALASSFVATAADGDTVRAEIVGTYLDNVLRLLHGHHEAEDALMTPRLVERCSPEEAQVVLDIADMHQDVSDDLAAAEAALAAWRATAAAHDRDELVALIARLEATLTAHLDREEREVLPLAGRHIDVAEWGELPAHGMRHFTGDKLWLVIGLIQEQMPPEAVAVMEAHMPPPVLRMWEQPGRRMFSDFMVQLRS